MDFVQSPFFDAHERVAHFADARLGLLGIIAVHSTALGPAMGGCRLARYASAEAALADALRLSQGMSYKNALAGLSAGGAKAVIHQVLPGASREAVFEAFGTAVEALGGVYVTAEDVGTGVADMVTTARRTRYVAGLPRRSGLAGGDPSPWTALGVFKAMQAAAEDSLDGARVAVQGLGSVGYRVCEHLHGAGARLVVADVDADRTCAAERDFSAEIAPIDRIHAADADVFSPNALGAVLNAETIAELGAPVVCGGANNQLATAQDGQRLLAHGVTYAPDYVVNAGGIINVMAEYAGEPATVVGARVHEIGGRLRELLERARRERRPPHEIAEGLARARIRGATAAPAS